MSEDLHTLRIEPVDEWASASADLFATAIKSAIEQRDRCLIALSGGMTPRPVLAELATRSVDWDRVVVFQADELIVHSQAPERNLTAQQEAFKGLPVTWVPMPVDKLLVPSITDQEDLRSHQSMSCNAQLDAIEMTQCGFGDNTPGLVVDTIEEFSRSLVEIAGDPPVLDIVQLGFGVQGHTASLLPGDPSVNELRQYVALTGKYKGHRRLTLTRPVLDRARLAIWLVRGADKRVSLNRVLAGDLSIPAGLIRPRQSVVVADEQAAVQV